MNVIRVLQVIVLTDDYDSEIFIQLVRTGGNILDLYPLWRNQDTLAPTRITHPQWFGQRYARTRATICKLGFHWCWLYWFGCNLLQSQCIDNPSLISGLYFLQLCFKIRSFSNLSWSWSGNRPWNCFKLSISLLFPRIRPCLQFPISPL